MTVTRKRQIFWSRTSSPLLLLRLLMILDREREKMRGGEERENLKSVRDR